MAVGRHAKIFVIGLLFSYLGIQLATINFAPQNRGVDPREVFPTLLGVDQLWWVLPINAGIQWAAFRAFPKLSGFWYSAAALAFGWFILWSIYYHTR